MNQITFNTCLLVTLIVISSLALEFSIINGITLHDMNERDSRNVMKLNGFINQTNVNFNEVQEHIDHTNANFEALCTYPDLDCSQKPKETSMLQNSRSVKEPNK